MNHLLYGHNPKERVLAVHQLNDRFIRLYVRHEGKIQQEDAEFFPFFFLSDELLLQGFPKQFWLKKLEGNLYYGFIAAFGRWSEMWEAVNHALKAYNKNSLKKASHYNEVESILLKPDPVNQFLLQSGITLFKGMEFDELHRLQIDIVRSQRTAGGRSRSPDGQIESILLSDNRGWEDVIESDRSDDAGALSSLISRIGEKDPDVIEGHGLQSNILPFLDSRCEALTLELAIGRDGTSVKHQLSRQPFWTPDAASGFYEVAGRHFVDTRRLAEFYGSSARSLKSLDLDYLAGYFALDAPTSSESDLSDRTTVTQRKQKGEKSGRHENVHRICRLSEHLSLNNFYLSQICPYNLGSLPRIGSAAKIESILLREYLRQRHSLPRPLAGSQARGGYTDIFFTGVYPHVLHADVESLYPSIITSQNIKPRSDVLDVFIPVLTGLTEMRLEAKRSMQQSALTPARNRLDAFQSALKILINSFYGYLAYGRAHFNDFEQADRITALGQTYLHTTIEQARMLKARVIEVDTDGLFFIPPEDVLTGHSEESFVNQLAETLPPGINLILAGRYEKMLSYKKKNYALLERRGKVLLRGSSLISRNLEPFARRYIEQCVEDLLNEDFLSLHNTYTTLRQRIVSHHWHVREFSRSETIKDVLETYEAEIKRGERQRSSAIEAAKRAGMYPRQGMVVTYYVTGVESGVKIADNCRIAEEWDSNLPDENSSYYLSRLNECSLKFKDLFTPTDYDKIFSPDDLFGFSASGISIVNRELQPQRTEMPTEESEDEFPIWLDDLPQ